MKPLHRTIVERSRAGCGSFTPSPATAEQIAAAELRLGALPPAYRSFLAEVGAAPWPLQIGNVVDPGARRSPHMPEWFVPFARDAGGNCYGFDVRKRRGKELAIEYWDEEAWGIDDAPCSTASFAALLSDLVRAGLTRDHAQRRERVFAALAPRAAGAFTPSAREVVAAGRALGVELPDDYVWFTTTLGSLPAPLRVVDGLDLAELTAALRQVHPDAPPQLAAFAREGEREFVAFTARGDLRYLGRAAGPPTFLDYLESLLARAAPRPASREPAPVVRRARPSDPAGRLRRLLERLQADDHIETAADFSAAAVATELASVPLNGAAIVAALLDRDDVLEVFVTDADVDALLDD